MKVILTIRELPMHSFMNKFNSVTRSIKKSTINLSKVSTVTLFTITLGLSGCQTIKNLKGPKKGTVETAKYVDSVYYQRAIDDIKKQRYIRAGKNLKELRTFFPTSQYAQQALLDLMYVEYEQGKYEEAVISAKQFISLYPSNPQIDYAYYVLGVSNMAQASSSLFKLNQAARDTAYYRLAFSNFAALLSQHPDSIYTADAAQRMTFIYNQFAEHELHVARWYIKRKAYVATANRAKWIFKYYPQSDSVPEAIAILAYSYDKLGMNDLANEYKTLLSINYPNWLTTDGNVKLSDRKKINKDAIVHKFSFGKLGQPKEKLEIPVNKYNGQTKPQSIRQISQLELPSE